MFGFCYDAAVKIQWSPTQPRGRHGVYFNASIVGRRSRRSRGSTRKFLSGLALASSEGIAMHLLRAEPWSAFRWFRNALRLLVGCCLRSVGAVPARAAALAVGRRAPPRGPACVLRRVGERVRSGLRTSARSAFDSAIDSSGVLRGILASEAVEFTAPSKFETPSGFGRRASSEVGAGSPVSRRRRSRFGYGLDSFSVLGCEAARREERIRLHGVQGDSPDRETPHAQAPHFQALHGPALAPAAPADDRVPLTARQRWQSQRHRSMRRLGVARSAAAATGCRALASLADRWNRPVRRDAGLHAFAGRRGPVQAVPSSSVGGRGAPPGRRLPVESSHPGIFARTSKAPRSLIAV